MKHTEAQRMTSNSSQPTIGILSEGPQTPRFIEEIENRGGIARIIHPDTPTQSKDHLSPIDGIILANHMNDRSVTISQRITYNDELLSFLQNSLTRKIPFLAIGEGMLTLNHLFPKSQAQNIARDSSLDTEPTQDSLAQIFVPPGSKLASIIGCGGFFKVDRLDCPRLPLASISKNLMVNAYSLHGTWIEGIESINHPWAIGINWLPYPNDQSSRAFTSLFSSLLHCANK